MKVSIITVCFNSVAMIEDTIRSVREQTYEEVEHIVVDGGSTDGTQEIVSRHNRRIQKFISEPDRGIYDAMNKGLRLARGDVVGFLNADDVYASPTAVGDIVAALQADHTDGAYGDLVYVGRDSNRVVRYWRAGTYRPRAFYSGWVPPHPTFFCRTALYGELGGFDPAYRIAGDFELRCFASSKRTGSAFDTSPNRSFACGPAGGRTPCGGLSRAIARSSRRSAATAWSSRPGSSAPS